ncbi:MAG: FAD-binding oxidoreductase, partial [Burkholderiaceae bacterium]|nr:FAD-binding oxidoreductase [Burkholderiaceae bacterium]
MTKMPPSSISISNSLPPEITFKLQKEVKGQVMVDSASRGRYSTDASIYQQFPLAVLVPESAQDIEAGLSIAKESGIPVLPRGGGTSQCGQTTGAALVIDNSKYFRNI